MGLLLAAAAVSCRGDQPTVNITISAPPVTASPVTSTPAPGPTATPGECTDASVGPSFSLVMVDNVFQPSCLAISSAQAPILSNQGAALHNLSVEGAATNIDVQPGTQFQGAPLGLAPGTYRLFCKYHEDVGMVGELRVT